MSRDRLLCNKWTVQDRMANLRAMADRHSEQHYSDYDRDMFARISNAISLEMDALTAHVKQEEPAKAWKPGDDGVGTTDMTARHDPTLRSRLRF